MSFLFSSIIKLFLLSCDVSPFMILSSSWSPYSDIFFTLLKSSVLNISLIRHFVHGSGEKKTEVNEVFVSDSETSPDSQNDWRSVGHGLQWRMIFRFSSTRLQRDRFEIYFDSFFIVVSSDDKFVSVEIDFELDETWHISLWSMCEIQWQNQKNQYD